LYYKISHISIICYYISHFISILGQVNIFGGTTSQGSADGVGTNAKFFYPTGVAVNPIGTLLYVADRDNNNIRTIALPSGI
jgi:DNA-binding beta-propeller fold protein YncE